MKKGKVSIDSLVASPKIEEPNQIIIHLSRWETLRLGWLQARSHKSQWLNIRYSMLARRIANRYEIEISPKTTTLSFNAFLQILEIKQ